MRLSIFILLSLLMPGCELTEGIKVQDPAELNYPTTISILSDVDYANKSREFEILNDYQICTRLNEFGFCEYDLSPCMNRPVLREEITDEEEMMRMAVDCIEKNRSFTGVSDIDDLAIKNSSGMNGCIRCDGSAGDIRHIKWRINFANQIYNGYEVLYSEISVILDKEGVYMIGGNQYPSIAVPANDVFDLNEAKQSLHGKEINYICWTPIELTITQDNIQEEARKVIIPLALEDKIQLRVAWEINIMISDGHAFWAVYVDSTTGEIILELPLIIC